MADQRIIVSGLDELRKAIKGLQDADATAELKDAGYVAAAQVVIPGAKSKAAALGKMQAKAADTLKPVRTVAGGAVRFGGGFPAAMGAEFGAAQNQPRGMVGGHRMTGWNQFEPWRGSGIDAGYFLWPTIRSETEQIVDRYADGISKLATRLGWQ